MPDEKTLILKDPTLKSGFTSVPNIVLTSDLSFGAKVIYALLLMFAWQDKETFPGQARLAQAAGCTERTVRTYLNELKEAGLITWKRRGLTQTNVYYINKLDSFLDRKYSSDQDWKHSDRKSVSYPDRKQISDQDEKQVSDKEYSDQEYSDQKDTVLDRVTIDSLRSSIVTRGPQIENEQETDIQNSCIEPFQIPENDLTSAGIFEEKDSSERKCDLFKKIIPGDTRTGINDKDSTSEKVSSLSDKVTGSSNTSNTNESIEIQETPQITNRDLITMLGDTLREAWDGPPGKAYAIAGRMYYLYDYPAAEASINNFCRQVKNGFKPKNPIAYLMKVAREKKKEFESEYEVSQPEEELEYFSIQYPEEHKKRVAEAKRVSAEHERYLKDYRDFLINKAPPIPGFITPGGCYKQLQEGGMKCN